MEQVIDQGRFTKALFEILEEAFETHHGIFLDKGDSLFETLSTISSEEASRPVGEKCATLAAQVAHVTFYLDVNERYLLTRKTFKVDWGEIWMTVGAVSPEEWARLQRELRATYERVCEMLRGLSTWDDSDAIEVGLSMAIHTAYHLGEIRQALCTLK
jgi:hypothetical protein